MSFNLIIYYISSRTFYKHLPNHQTDLISKQIRQKRRFFFFFCEFYASRLQRFNPNCSTCIVIFILFFLFLIKTFNSLKARLVFTYESPSWQCNLWRLPPDASAAASLYRLLTQRWSPPPWIMHEIRVQITPINMQYSLRWLNCHLIVMNMWKMSGTTYSPPLLILTFPFFFFFFLHLKWVWEEVWKYPS